MNVESILAVKGRGVITIDPDQTIRAALLKMEEHNIGSLVILDDFGKMIGILTERHIIRQASKLDDFLSRRVSEVMKTKVISGMPQDDLHSLAHTMLEKRVRHLPILDQGELVGIVSIGDVLKAQRDLYHGELRTLETQILAK